MAISPPSDIVLDVAQAADPLRYQEATGRLRQLSYQAAPEAFGETLEEVLQEPAPQLPFDAAAALTRLRSDTAVPRAPTGTDGAAGGPTEAFRNFEAMALTSFVETMLPQNASSVFGSGTAGQIWKSMLAEQIGQQIARAGGVGIAAQLMAAHPAGAETAAAATGPDIATLAAGALVAETERGFITAGSDQDSGGPAAIWGDDT